MIELTEEDRAKIQRIELGMLAEFDRVCRANDIPYSIIGGSLLGAVRHKGFIPWDDDIDVALLRADYERFKQVARQLDPAICHFQDHSTEPAYIWGYGKLRAANTEFVRIGQEHLTFSTGLPIDVFPLDDVPDSTVGQMWCDFRFFCLRKILYAQVGKVEPNAHGAQRRLYCALSHISPEWAFKRLGRIAQRSLDHPTSHVRVVTFASFGKYFRKHNKLPLSQRYAMPKLWFTELDNFPFENITVLGSRHFDAYLTFSYGDYLTLPPKEKRVGHHFVSHIKL